MDVACVLVTHFPVKIELQRQPSLQGRPLLVVQPSGRRRVILDWSPEAGGTAEGMSLEHALSRCPSATVIEADPQGYRAAWDRILDALEGVSPLVEDTDLGLAYVDLKGLEGIYGDEANLARAVIQAAPQ